MRNIFFKPSASARCEEYRSLLVSLSHNPGFASFKIDHGALHVERFRYPHAGSNQNLNQCPARKPAHVKTLIRLEDWNSREKSLNFLGCEKHDITPGYAGKADLLR